MPDNEVNLNLDKFEKIKKDLLKNYSVKVGVIGSKNSRNDESTNAGIGLLMEFGSIEKNITPASFLRMPLYTKLPKKIQEIGKDVFDSLNKENIEGFFKKLGIIAEVIIQDAFDSGGFGKWPENSQVTIAIKGFNKRNIETTQLRRSITSEVI